MPFSDAFVSNNDSSSQYGLLSSSLTGTSLSTLLDDNSSLIDLQKALITTSASNPISSLHDSLTTYLVSSNFDNSLLFNKLDFSASAFSQSVENSSINNKNISDFDPLIGNTNLVSLGKFGDFDGHQDFQLTLQDANGNPESFSLTGEGEGEVFQTSQGEQIIFTGTDASTTVQITTSNNIKFGNYIGASLSVQTKGSITSGNITLKNTALSNNTGLSLQSGLSELQNSSSNTYNVIDFTALIGSSSSYVAAINDSGQIVGNDGQGHAFLYSDGQMTDLGILPGGFSSEAKAINNSSQIIGTAITSDYIDHAFLYSDGKMTDLGTLIGNGYTSAMDINDSGQAVGLFYSADTSYYYHAFLYSDGKMTDLGTLPRGKYSQATAINDAGQITGYSQTADFIDGINEMTGMAYSSEPGFVESSRYFNQQNHAFLYSNGQMTDLGTLSGGIESEATDINNAGQIVGYSRNNDGYDHAFLYSNGQMADLGTLSGNSSSSSYAEAINDAGQIVGYSGDTRHAFLYKDGKMSDLNSLIPSNSGWTLSYATAINNKGQILGSGVIGGQSHQFLLNPISTTATPKDGITVGNISTQGGSVFLQGLKINLTGSNVVTKGGNITLDGPTILNSSTGAYTFNSAKSTATSKGGDITFKNTLDSNSAGASSLSLTGGLGNITFNNAVGGNASLKDLTVNSAKTFTANGDITSQGNITLNAIDDITTASLSTTDSGNVSIYLGKIGDKKYDSKGDVTTGSISAKQVDILSDGAFRTQGDIQTQDGDVNITALKDIVVHNITSTNAGISLISATKAITATGEIIGDYGVTALAKQNITTEKIHSANDVVLLNSSQGAVTVNGSITSDSDVFLSAFKNVVTQDITSFDGAVALISSNGNVKAQGEIASADNLSLGAFGKVATENITSTYGTVTLLSTSGAVTAKEINGGSDITISAQQKIATGKIGSQWGNVGLISKQGIVAVNGDVTTDNGDVYLSSVGNIVSQNIISNGGTITITSMQGAVTTGYLRSDTNRTGGKINIQAAGLVRIIGSVAINNHEYSIYTSLNKKNWLTIAYKNSDLESSNLKKSKTRFIINDPTLIGNTNLSGTVADISTGRILSYEPSPIDPGLPNWARFGIEILRKILNVPPPEVDKPGSVPSHVTDYNPITNKPYGNDRERELVEKLTRGQKFRLRLLIDYDRIEEKKVFEKGTVDTEHGCFKLELDEHLGDDALDSDPELGNNTTHSKYATYVTGSQGDFLVINKSGLSAFYDGLVKADGAIVNNPNPEAPGSVAEVKTGTKYMLVLRKNLSEDNPNYLNLPLSQEEKSIFRDLKLQINSYIKVAEDCHLNFFLCFSNKEAGLAAKSIFEDLNPRNSSKSVRVHYMKLPANL